MPEPLPVEELQSLEDNLPHLRSSPALMHLAGLKLLPQQHDVPSFENPDFLTGLRRTVFGHTKKEQQLLKRQQEALVPFQQEQQLLAKLNAQQQFMQSIAPPSYAEAGRRIPGMERLAPMQETTQPASQLLPFNEKGYQDAALLPGTFDVGELGPRGLRGFTQSTPAIPIRDMPAIQDQAIPFQQPNPQARLSPADVALYNQMAGQPSAIDPETGALTPMPLAKPRLDMAHPDQIVNETDFREKLGIVPHGTTDALRKAPLAGPIPRHAAESALSDLTKRETDKSYADRTLAAAQRDYLSHGNLQRTLAAFPTVRADEVRKADLDPNKPLVAINTQQPASEEAQKEFMKSSRATYDQLKHAPVVLRNIAEAKGLVQAAKGFMGPGGEMLLEAAKFLNNRLGMNIGTTGIRSAEELRSRIFFNIMDNLKKMDAQPSQQQQLIMMESLGKLGTDPNALNAILDAFGSVIQDKVGLHNDEMESAIARGVKFPYDPKVYLNGKKKPAASNDIDAKLDKLIEELKKAK